MPPANDDYRKRLAERKRLLARESQKQQREKAFSSPPKNTKVNKKTYSGPVTSASVTGMGLDFFGNRILGPAIQKAQGDISEIPNIGKSPEGSLFGLLGIGSVLSPTGKSSVTKSGKILNILENISQKSRDIDEDIAEYLPEASESMGRVIIPRGEDLMRTIRAISYPDVETDEAFEAGLSKLIPRVSRLTASFDNPNFDVPLDEAMQRRFISTMQGTAKQRLGGSPIFSMLLKDGLINPSKEMTQDQWNRATSVMRYFTGDEGLLPLNITGRVQKGQGEVYNRPFAWQADHAPWGISWLDEAINANVKDPSRLSSKAKKELAKGYNYIMNRSGVWIPKPANIALGSVNRVGLDSPGWQALSGKFPNMAAWLRQAGLPSVYDEMAQEMSDEASTAFKIASEYGSDKDIKRFLQKAAQFAGKTAGI